MVVPFHIRVYETLTARYDRRYLPVKTKTIAAELYAPYRRTLRALRKLERTGLVTRKSERGGWKPSVMAAAVYRALLTAYRRSHDYVATTAVAVALNTDDGWCRQYLRKLESAGLVERRNYYSGWRPIRSAPTPAAAQITLLLEDMHYRRGEAIHTNELADILSVNPRYARHLLAQAESNRAISRHSPRGGWLPVPA